MQIMSVTQGIELMPGTTGNTLGINLVPEKLGTFQSQPSFDTKSYYLPSYWRWFGNHGLATIV